MDPNATLQQIAEALNEGRLEDAREYRGYLGHWLSRGGFQPLWDSVSEEVKLFCRLAI